MIQKPNQYWKKRYQKESEYVLNCDANEAAKELQEMFMKLAENLINKINASYVNTKSKEMLLQRDKKLLKEIDEKLEELGVDTEKLLGDKLKRAYKDGAKLTGNYLELNNRDYKQLDAEGAKRALEYVNADDGLNWSKRIWNDVAALKVNLNTHLAQAIANGEGAMPLTSTLMKDFSVSYSKAKRLAVTEISHIYNQGSLDRMQEAGVSKYEWYTAQDCKVCEICNKMDGKKFPIDDKEHIPPFFSHPNCRCTVLAVIDI